MRALFAFLLLAAAAGFVWLGAQPWLAAPLPVETARPAPAATEAPAGLALRDAPPTDLSRIAERPLFSAVRRPPPPEAPGAPIEAEDPNLLFGAYEIAGVVVLGDAAMAMLRDDAGRLLRLRAGDSLPTPRGESEVVKITLTSLTFRRAGEMGVANVRGQGSGAE